MRARRHTHAHNARAGRKRNLFGLRLFKSKQAAGKGKRQRRSSMTIIQALRAAKRAGKASGDTGTFRSWLERTGLADRSPKLIEELRKEYVSWVDAPRMRKPTAAGAGSGISHAELEKIAKSLGGKSYADLSPQQKEMAQEIARKLRNPRYGGLHLLPPPSAYLRVTACPSFRAASPETQAAILTVARAVSSRYVLEQGRIA